MKPKEIGVVTADPSDFAEPDEIELQIMERQKNTPDILRELARFLNTVADYYDQGKEN